MPVTPEFAKTLELLRDASHPFPPKALYQFSDLPAEHLAALKAAWPEVDEVRRQHLLEDLDELTEANTETNFDEVFRLGLADAAPPVRVAALQGLWEAEAPSLMARFLDMLAHDPAPAVRAAAASALGRFVFLGEVEDLSPAQARRVEDTLLAVYHGADELEVRRRALEALAFSSRQEVEPLIRAAYAAPDEKLRLSAVFAMGRSAHEQWEPRVLAELESVSPAMRFEASRAAGELELEAAVPALARMGEDGDRQVREAALWSLSQVGGEAARKALQRLLRRAEDDEKDFIRDALENLDFTDEMHAFTLFDIGLPDGAALEDDDSALPDDTVLPGDDA